MAAPKARRNDRIPSHWTSNLFADGSSAGNGFVGMALRLDEELQAVVVTSTLPDSPAKKAGLLAEDVVLSIGGDAATDLRSAINSVRRGQPKSELVIRIRRGTEDMELKVKVGVVPFAMLTGLD
jgi:S1-C subfamily serine protease